MDLSLLALAGLGMAVAITPINATIPPVPLLAEGVRADMAAEVNAIRIQHGCRPLRQSQQLDAAALRQAQAMARDNFFDHVAPDGTTLGVRVAATGYRFTRASENIAAGQRSVRAVVATWMASDAHRANILDCTVQEIGIAYLFDAEDAPFPGDPAPMMTYWVQVFARPMR
jgi:uncharacterized protein YkwD